ncbi:four helix bundle protein [Algoriphagus ratkowskyi]|uniref:Four helix bundle protein n=1 Tax=Algoriphagus ratkowskyi TaxID=57028 RepID=A0A2W7QRB1_9BACT|nr:four helix bundle protein [Algoriphagus ratkowskyi]PZX51083.1 four helix bundle protein [Algoriphagus ratkowskyi]TXD75871.1 four helix bundle protein [Algoriphagus ratkowskyi]
MERKYDLEARLIEFAAAIISFTDSMINTKAGNHMSNQLLRSGTSPALNYGEAQSGESRKDFIHKMKVVLKELRESGVAIKIIEKSKLHLDASEIASLQNECNQLISIFVKSIGTAERNIN